jgi:hypothetical protein
LIVPCEPCEKRSSTNPACQRCGGEGAYIPGSAAGPLIRKAREGRLSQAQLARDLKTHSKSWVAWVETERTRYVRPSALRRALDTANSAPIKPPKPPPPKPPPRPPRRVHERTDRLAPADPRTRSRGAKLNGRRRAQAYRPPEFAEAEFRLYRCVPLQARLPESHCEANLKLAAEPTTGKDGVDTSGQMTTERRRQIARLRGIEACLNCRGVVANAPRFGPPITMTVRGQVPNTIQSTMQPAERSGYTSIPTRNPRPPSP